MHNIVWLFYIKGVHAHVLIDALDGQAIHTHTQSIARTHHKERSQDGEINLWQPGSCHGTGMKTGISFIHVPVG